MLAIHLKWKTEVGSSVCLNVFVLEILYKK